MIYAVIDTNVLISAALAKNPQTSIPSLQKYALFWIRHVSGLVTHVLFYQGIMYIL